MSLTLLSNASPAFKEAGWLLLVTVLSVEGGNSTRNGASSTIATSVSSHEVCVSAGGAHERAIQMGRQGSKAYYNVAWSCHKIPDSANSPALMLMTVSLFDSRTTPSDGSISTVSITMPEKKFCNAVGEEHRSAVEQAYKRTPRGNGANTTYAVSWSCTELAREYNVKNSPLLK